MAAMDTRVGTSETQLSDGANAQGIDHFRRFLCDNGIDPQIYASVGSRGQVTHPRRRFVRCSPCAPERLTLEDLRRELGVDDVRPLTWLPESFEFYSLPEDANISSCAAYRNGSIYGMDVSSGAAVAALDVRPGHSVLDVCCAPGAKLCLLADVMRRRGTLIGVDASRERLAVCKRMLTKYGIERHLPSVLADGPAGISCAWRCRVLCADGTSFRMAPCDEACPSGATLVFDSTSAAAEHGGAASGRKRMNKSARAREQKRLRLLAAGEELPPAPGPANGKADRADISSGCGNRASPTALEDAPAQACSPGEPVGSEPCLLPGGDLYDRVIVDAQCTHDGSWRHVVKLLATSGEVEGSALQASEPHEHEYACGDVADARLRESFAPERLAELRELQRSLVANGFTMLRPGGSMVYATCSLARAQNEDIVSWLLQREAGKAFLEATGLCVSDSTGDGGVAAPCMVGGLPHTLRFTPEQGTSGLFIARIGKRVA
eukprot:TRINITY_DN72359_c0_g1_i1.p1 TRINITY_DN72359_c0_g1~~TRINITY_DN72359_c0_g1_i1.p1  ORF type:complete len:492 (+),score=41.91 TRINITY_DN72359_c0_g1_i1:72-1547(+)